MLFTNTGRYQMHNMSKLHSRGQQWAPEAKSGAKF